MRVADLLALLAPALLVGVAAPPCRAFDGAELELLASSISRAGAPANFGFPVDSPDLVTDDDSVTPLGVHGDHEDAEFMRDRVYRNAERVNGGRLFGESGPARGSIEAGHSLSVTTGYADAGRNELGGWAEASAGNEGPSTGSASSSMRIEKRITIEAGASGLVDGALVTGLRWVLDGAGFLGIAGRSFPNASAVSASASLDLLVLRGPTGTCGPFDCPHGALAVAADLATGVSVLDEDPAVGGRTARVLRHDSWSASNNAGSLKAGAVFESGSETVEVGLPITDEDAAIQRVEGVATGAAPLALDAIEFEANVGETLTVEMRLDLAAVVAGRGAGESDFFSGFDGHVEDPQGRGLVFASSVPVPEPGGAPCSLAALAALALAGARQRGASPSDPKLAS